MLQQFVHNLSPLVIVANLIYHSCIVGCIGLVSVVCVGFAGIPRDSNLRKNKKIYVKCIVYQQQKQRRKSMTNLTKKLLTVASVLGAVVLLAGCSGCPAKKHHQKPMHKAQHMQPVELIESDTIVVYQTYEDADVKKLYAKMYTHSSRGGESKMGHIKFRETENGLKWM